MGKKTETTKTVLTTVEKAGHIAAAILAVINGTKK